MTRTRRVRGGVKVEARRRRCRSEAESLDADAARHTITSVMPVSSAHSGTVPSSLFPLAIDGTVQTVGPPRRSKGAPAYPPVEEHSREG